MNAKVQYTQAYKLVRMFNASRISYDELQDYFVTFHISPKFAHLAFKSLNARTEKVSCDTRFLSALYALWGK